MTIKSISKITVSTKSLSDRSILIYCICLFLFSWALQIICIDTTNGMDDPKIVGWLAAAMLTPCVVTIGFLWFNPFMRSKLLWRPSWKLINATFFAVLFPILIAFAVLVIFESMHWGKSQWFDFSSSGVNISGGPFLVGLGAQSWVVFMINIFITGLAFALLNSIIAAGEEIAWRGLLQGLLIERLGKWKGILLLGFLWSMWHLPIQLAGYNYPENPIVGSLIISPFLLIAYSFFMAWITLYSKSFIPAAVAHGAMNGIQEGIIYHIDLAVPELYVYLIRVLTAVVVGLVSMVFLARMKS